MSGRRFHKTRPHLDFFQPHSLRPVLEAGLFVVTPVIRLNEYVISVVLHTVAELSLDTHVGNFAEAVIIRAGSVSTERISVRVCVRYCDQHLKINLVRKGCTHDSSSSDSL